MTSDLLPGNSTTYWRSLAARRLLSLQENDTTGRRHFQHLTRRSQAAGIRVHAKQDDHTRVLISSEKIRAGRVQRKVPRCLALGRDMLDRRQRAFGGVNCEHRNAVVASI